jgi:quinol monooxygenase YgiN
VYRSADDDTHVFLYAQLRDLTLADALLAGAREVERSTWILAGSFHGADPSRVAEMPTGHVTSVQFSLKPGTLPRMLAAARSDIEQTGGIKRFDVAQNTSDPCRFHICARWVSRDAWEQHNATPEYAALAALLGELHVGPPIRTLWRALMPVPAEQRASR